MVEFLWNIDHALFQVINMSMANDFFDLYLPVLRNKYIWFPIYVFIISFTIIKLKLNAYYLILSLILTVGISDFISSTIIKKSIQRLRPCNNVEYSMIQRVDCGSGYSFTSSHASNHFALSFFLIIAFQPKRFIKALLISWAMIVSFAQVYVGVHYPSDVLFGGLLGIGTAFLIGKLYMQYLYPLIKEEITS